MLALLGLLPCLPLGLCVWRLTRPRSDTPPGRLDSLLRGVGLVAVWVLPAIVLQWALMLGGRLSTTFELDDLVALPFSWWVLVGGRTVQEVFEATVEDLTGHRQSTMLDNWPYYAALAYVQALALGGVVARRFRSGRGALDPIVLTAGLAALANACLGATWPWWGT